MSESQTPGTRSLSPSWALLLLPVGLFVGWAVGGLPTPTAQETKSVAVETSTQAAGPTTSPTLVEAPRNRRSSFNDDQADRSEAVAPAPEEVEKPRRETQLSGEVSRWSTLEQAMSESARNGKPVLIDFNADWCGPCKRMKEQVFEDPSRGHAVQTAVIPVSIVDRAREEGRNSPEVEILHKRFGVDAFPTLIVYSAATGRIVKTQGFGDPEATLAWITEAAREVTSK